MPPTADDLEALIYRAIARYGPGTVADIVAALGEDAEQISETMSRLLDTHRLVVAGVTADGKPLYDAAPSPPPPPHLPLNTHPIQIDPLPQAPRIMCEDVSQVRWRWYRSGGTSDGLHSVT